MDFSHAFVAASFLHSQTCVASSSWPHLGHSGVRRCFHFIIIVLTPQMPEVCFRNLLPSVEFDGWCWSTNQRVSRPNVLGNDEFQENPAVEMSVLARVFRTNKVTAITLVRSPWSYSIKPDLLRLWASTCGGAQSIYLSFISYESQTVKTADVRYSLFSTHSCDVRLNL